MRRLFLCIFMLPLTIAAYSQCTPAGSDLYTFITAGKKYEIVKLNKTWADAAACAKSRGAALAEISSQEEQDTLFYHVNKAGIVASNTTAPDGGGASYLWIGGNDISTEGSWVWDGDNDGVGVQFWQGSKTGSPVGGLYNHWGNEPDNYNEQDALGFAYTAWPYGVPGQWNDLATTNSLYFIIEYAGVTGIAEEAPATIALLPNPARDVLRVENTLTFGSTYSIVNMCGSVVMRGNLNPGQAEINIAALPPGLYFLYATGKGFKFLKSI